MVIKVLKRMYREQRWVLWPVMAAMTVGLFSIMPYESLFIEQYYSRGIFLLFRQAWDHTLGLVPIPLVYILIATCLYYLLSSFFTKAGRKAIVFRFFKRLTLLCSVLLISFYWLWGFNYKRVDIRGTYNLSTKQEISVDEVFAEYERVTDSLNSIRALIGVPNSLSDNAWPNEDDLRDDLEKLYVAINLPTQGKVRVRKIRPKGTLLHISTAGVYLPFVGEGHIDAGLHPITHPFTAMHEMSHGYGWTGEDVCNFLALLGTIRSKNTKVRYSGYLAYWRYLRSNAYRADNERFKSLDTVPYDEVKKDYNEILDYQDRYPDIMPKLRDLIYDSYLKSHGIPDGIVNYSAIVKLAHAWQQNYGSLANDPEKKSIR